MKVGILSLKGNFNRGIGQGVQKYIYEIWNNTNRLAKTRGDSVDKIEFGYGNSYMLRKVSFTLMLGIKSFNGYDILHIPAPIMFNPRHGKETKVVTTLHEFALIRKDSPIYTEPRREGMFSGYIGRKIREQVINSDYIIPNSTQTEQEAIQIGCDRNKIEVVPHAIDDKFIYTPVPERKQNKRFRLGFIGRIGSRKNVKFAIDSFKSIENQKIDFEIWGNVVPDYAHAVKIPEGEDRIQLKGFAPEESIVKIFDSFDAFAFPSLYEGFGMEILEAQARGLPVITYAKAQIPDEIKKYCIEAKDERDMATIIMDLKENGYAQRTRKEAMEYAAQFNWNNCAKRTMIAYKNAMKL